MASFPMSKPVPRDKPAPSLDHLLDSPLLWRGRAADHTGPRGVSTQHHRLDAVLPAGGWPPGSLIELLSPVPGIGEMHLLLPTLAAFCARSNTESRTGSRTGTRRSALPASRIVLVDPPFLPYAPGLEQSGVRLDQLWWISVDHARDAAWASEQSLRSGACAAVLLWPRQPLTDKALRRLQLAAEQGRSLGFLLQQGATAADTSPAAVRIEVDRQSGRLDLLLRKCRGLSGRRQVQLPLPD